MLFVPVYRADRVGGDELHYTWTVFVVSLFCITPCSRSILCKIMKHISFSLLWVDDFLHISSHISFAFSAIQLNALQSLSVTVCVRVTVWIKCDCCSVRKRMQSRAGAKHVSDESHTANVQSMSLFVCVCVFTTTGPRPIKMGTMLPLLIRYLLVNHKP